MIVSIWIVVVLVPFLLLIEAFFAGSEIALLSADKIMLKTQAKHGSRSARAALSLADHPERVLSTTLVVTNLCMIGISSLISLYVLGFGTDHSELIAVAVTSPLIVILGELIPKTIFQRYSNRVVLWVAGPVATAYWVLYPITRVLQGYTTRLSRLIGPFEELISGKKRSMREELRSLLSYSKKESGIKPAEKRIIKRIFDFKDTEAKHALIPLVKIEAVEDTATAREALERFQAHRHSRMPVYSERIDNIVGVLDFSRLMSALDLNENVRKHITPAKYVAETQVLDDLLLEMRREDQEMVVIVDEYGGAIGILTFEDIVEEIVGEIQDEDDSESALYKEISPSSWLAQARAEIAQINERLRLEIPEGEYETLGGFLLQQFARIPNTGDELYFNTPAGFLKFTIRKATERQIVAVLIERQSQAE